jgi:hypothetical protein
MQGLWLSMGRIDEVWMCRAEVSSELGECVVSNKDAGRNVHHAIFSIKVPNGGAAVGCVTFAKDFLKVAVQKLNNSIIYNSIANLRLSNDYLAGKHTILSDSKRRRGCSRPELSKNDRPLRVAVEEFDLAVFEFEHVAARGVHLLTRSRELAKGKLHRELYRIYVDGP